MTQALQSKPPFTPDTAWPGLTGTGGTPQAPDRRDERSFDALLQATALAFDVPVVVLRVDGAERPWFRANVAVADIGPMVRDGDFSAEAGVPAGVREVPDITADPRFVNTPLLRTFPGARFYACAALRLDDGPCVGSLCVIDRVPRRLAPAQHALLRQLSVLAVEAFEAWRKARAPAAPPSLPAADITDPGALRTQQALLTERARLATLIDATGAGTWEWNAQTGEVRVNARWAEILGWTPEELGTVTNQMRADLAHPDEIGSTRELLRAHFAGRSEAYVADVRLRHRNGHWVWVQDRGRLITRTASGKPEWVFGTHIDITARKQQELELQHQRELLDRTGRLARVGGWEVDIRTGHLRWSDEVRSLHGLPPGYQPELATAINFYAPEARPAIQAAVELAMTQGVPWDLELPLMRADGSRTWVHTVGEVEIVNGAPVRIFGAIQDISDRHAMSTVLAHKTSELKRSNEELERFAYITSHDLQEPLRMVTSYGQLLTRRHLADLKPEAQEFIAYMVDGGQRAQALIRDLLSLARLDSRAQAWTPVPLENTLAQVLRPLRLLLQETGAEVSHDPLPIVVADAAQLGQLMANLVGNALKFRGQAVPRVHIGAAREGSGWRISVRDNGIGIEARYFDRIFQMFQRLHQRTEYEGTGIGLAICKKVVERHGGHMGVHSTPGQGSTFFFTLPDHGQGAPATASPTTEP